MTTYKKRLFSETSNGVPIVVNATAGSVTLIHSCIDSDNDYDEVWIYGCNTGSVPAVVSIVCNSVIVSIARIPTSSGMCLLVPGNVFNRGVLIGAFVNNSSSGKVSISGWVNRIFE